MCSKKGKLFFKKRKFIRNAIKTSEKFVQKDSEKRLDESHTHGYNEDNEID